LAVSRSPASLSERQLWRKQPLKLDMSEAIYDSWQSLGQTVLFSICDQEL